MLKEREERVSASGTTSWAGRTLTVFGASPGALWAFGGQNGLLREPADAVAYHNDLNVSRDGGATWSVVLADAPASPSRPSPRGMVNRLVYWRSLLWLVSGGTTESAADPNRHYYREVWSIDPDRTDAGWTRHANPPWLGVDYTSVELFAGKLWLPGGYSGDGYDGAARGLNTRGVWYSDDGERWIRHETPPWVETHAAATAVDAAGTELAFVAGNGAMTTAPDPPGASTAYSLVESGVFAA